MLDWDTLVLAPCEKIFGEPVIFTPVGGLPVSTTGIFDRSFRELEEAEPSQRDTILVSVGLRLSQLPREPAIGDTLEVPRIGIVFSVRQPRPDGKGNVRCILNYLRKSA